MQTLEFAIGFASCAHRKQKRKYTGEPYMVHCLEVAQIIKSYTDEVDMVVAAVMHDVLEDTDVTVEEMRAVFGDLVTNLVLEVTDVSKPSDGNRAVRKQIDRDHLAKSSVWGANIKLADLISNTGSIAKYDPDFAKVYLREKQLVLPLLKHGQPNLHWRATEVCQIALRQLDGAAA